MENFGFCSRGNIYMLTLAQRKVTINNLVVFLSISFQRLYWMLEFDQDYFERLYEYKSKTIFRN